MGRTARFNDAKKPLVTIVLQNHNNEKYIRQCFDSIISQTYDNLEINFYDLASIDNSWHVAIEYQKKYPGIINLMRLRKNYFVSGFVDHFENIRGKYFIRLNTNCELKQNLLNICVNTFTQNPTIGFTNIRKTIIKECGETKLEKATYSKTGLVNGKDHLLKLLIENAVAPPSVSMYRSDLVKIMKIQTDLSIQTEICLNHDMYYISDSYFIYRKKCTQNIPGEPAYLYELFDIISEKYLLINQLYFVKDNQKILDNIPQILRNLAELSLSQCVNEIKNNKYNNAIRFFHFSAAVYTDIANDLKFLTLKKFFKTNNKNVIENYLDSAD